MYRIASPDDLMLQLFSLQRQRTNPGRSGETSDARRELLDLILTFNANSDASSDNEGDTISQDDLFY